jgi:hypothetical protein
MRYLIFALFYTLLHCEKFQVPNCHKCNDEICIYDNINASIYFKSCICEFPLCGDRCKSHNISRKDINTCIRMGVFCNNQEILRLTGTLIYNFLGFLAFIIMCGSLILSVLITPYDTNTFPKVSFFSGLIFAVLCVIIRNTDTSKYENHTCF